MMKYANFLINFLIFLQKQQLLNHKS